jgi:primosomal protein N' (replication factor Y)
MCSEGEVMAAAVPAPYRTTGSEKTAAYQPKFERYIALHQGFLPEEKLAELLNNWKGAPRQLALLLAYIELHQKKGEVSAAVLLKRAGASASLLKALIEKEILVEYRKQVDRIDHLPVIHSIDFTLSAPQEEAFDQIKACCLKSL